MNISKSVIRRALFKIFNSALLTIHVPLLTTFAANDELFHKIRGANLTFFGEELERLYDMIFG